MCGECNKIDPSLTVPVTKQYRSAIKSMIETVDGLLRSCVDLEDQYRSIGFSYHTTSSHARETMSNMEDLADSFIHIEDYFENNLPDQYELWDDKISRIVKKLSKLRSDMMHIPRQATVEQLVHEYDQVISPAIRELKWTVDNYQIILLQLAKEVIELHQIQMQDNEDMYVQNNEHEGPLPWWFASFDPVADMMRPEIEDVEWYSFMRWLSCLPEVRKALEQGKVLRDVAMAWILDREAGDIPYRPLRILNEKVV